jgi:ABC-type nitrate/sulfonate/bicarbonate transport system substrate-binding protein
MGGDQNKRDREEGDMRFRSTALRAIALWVLAFWVLALPGALALTGAAQAQERLKVRFGILTTASQAAFYVGVKKGIFAKYGFDVDVRPLTTGVQANQALAAGQVDWSGGGVESTVVAWATKLPFKAYSMYARAATATAYWFATMPTSRRRRI